MTLSIHNPYSREALPWHRGNLHTHTSNSDGGLDPQGVIDEYASRGYGFLMISDHDCFTDPAGLDPRGMALIPGNEVTGHGPHVLQVDARSRVEPDPDVQKAIDAIAEDGGFAIMCHPNWEAHFNHCPQAQLEAWTGYAGIEIYNGVVAHLSGSPLATDRWDRLLAQGRKVWGYAHDDRHRPDNVALAWNVVQAKTREPTEIVDALRNGRFYASTGVSIDHIESVDHTLRLRAPDAHRIVAYGDSQARVSEADGNEIELHIPEDTNLTYVRFECWGCGENMAWTQPFFIERSESGASGVA